MFMLDALEPQQQVMVVAQASQTRQAKPKKEYAMGVCEGVYSDYPAYLAPYSLLRFGHLAEKYWGLQDIPDYIKPEHIQVIRAPEHGKLIYVAKPTDADVNNSYNKSNLENGYYSYYEYTPKSGYMGNDKVTFKINVEGKVFKVVYVLKMSTGEEDSESHPWMYCNKESWKISGQTPDGTPVFSNEDTAVSSVDTYTPTPSPLLGNYSNNAYPNLTYSFTDLPGTALGETKSTQTTGSGAAANILLDINAAGRGWFMDSTPLSNDDYLPTSNPNEWIAKAGSAAADKMDLLSALVGWVEV